MVVCVTCLRWLGGKVSVKSMRWGRGLQCGRGCACAFSGSGDLAGICLYPCEADLLQVPSDLPMEQTAISFINPPTAYCLLNKVVDLPRGSWVLQNAGNSAVGLQ